MYAHSQLVYDMKKNVLWLKVTDLHFPIYTFINSLRPGDAYMRW